MAQKILRRQVKYHGST